jgi:type VI secretion system (T6SS) effector TldE1-like protein
MSTSTGASGLSAPKRRNSRKSRIEGFTGSAAVAALVIGCAWTVYSNILGAGIYPSVNSTAAETPVVKQQMSSIVRKAPALIINHVFADLPQATASIGKVESSAVPSIMFNERFAAASAESVAPKANNAPQLASASASTETANFDETAKKASASASVQIALATPGLGAPPKTVDAKPAKASSSSREMTQRAKAAVMSIGHEKPSMVEKLWGKDVANGPLLAYASADAKIDITGSLKEQNPMLGGSPPYDKSTAVYVITHKTVYLPDGTQLEAHSGLGSKMDDPKYSHVRMQGVTPPHIYEMKPREALFHGVPALRLNPIGGEEKIFGRDGLLAHTYMLGGNGQSNGCVSFRDYYAFLDAYKNKGIRRLAVVAKLD